MHDMEPSRQAHVHEVSLALRPGVDPAAPGAAVTVALCGHWDHEPPCRWPHNNRLVDGSGASTLRTVFVCDPDSEAEVRRRIDTALRATAGWNVLRSGAAPIPEDDAELGLRLLAGPHQ